MRARPATDPFFTRRDLHADSDVIARLADGVTAEQARAELEAVAARIAAVHPDEAGEFTRIRLTPLRDRMIGDVTSLLLVLAAAVGLVLLIACVNVADLVLARALARTRELAVRAALGAGRGRIVRQLLTEALLLAFGGAVAGTVLAAAAVRLFAATAPGALPRLDEVAVDGRVLVFAIAVAASAALLSGLVPALRAAAPDLVPGLRSGTAGAGIERSGMRLRGGLVIAQVALTLVLLVAAGLLMRSLRNLYQEPLGFEPDGVVAVRIFPPTPRYEEAPAAAELFRRIREAAAGVPGVEAAAVANHIPVAGARMATPVRVPGREPPPDDGWVIFRTVSPEYFDVFRIPVLRGRPFVDADLARGGVAIVNEAFARTYLGDRDPIGASLTAAKAAQGRPDFGEPIPVRVVGLAGDVREIGPDAPSPPTIYVPYTANPWENTFLIVRAATEPRSIIPALRRAVLEVDPDLPVAGPSFMTQFQLMNDVLGRQLEQRDIQARLLAGFAAGALLLALVGLFGLLSQIVTQRTREIGVRIALGARRTQVVRLAIGQALRVVAAGIALGTAGALVATRVLRSSLYGVSAADPLTFAAAGLVFVAAALAAGYLPARRAARVDPVVALREE